LELVAGFALVRRQVHLEAGNEDFYLDLLFKWQFAFGFSDTVALRTLQQLLKKIRFQLTQKTISRTLSQWVSIIGAAGLKAYSYYDTKKVAETSIELFSQPFVIRGN
jgi:hypothetical protein